MGKFFLHFSRIAAIWLHDRWVIPAFLQGKCAVYCISIFSGEFHGVSYGKTSGVLFWNVCVWAVNIARGWVVFFIGHFRGGICSLRCFGW